jgi:hypothetical protein
MAPVGFEPYYLSVGAGEDRAVTVISSWTLDSVASVRERTIPTERSPLVGEVSANFSR